MTIELKKAAAGLLKATFCRAKEGLLNEYTGKYKSRLVCPLPAENGSRLVVEGSCYRKGNWQAYIETPVPGGGLITRNLSDLFGNVGNDNIIQRLDRWADSIDNHIVDQAYIEHVRIPLNRVLHAAPQTLSAQPKVPAAG